MIKHVSGGASGYDVFALNTILENVDTVRQILLDNFNLTLEEVNLFLIIAEMASEDIPKTLARLATGGEGPTIAGKIDMIKNMDLALKLQLSYSRISNQYHEILC